MAVVVPASPIILDPEHWQPRRPILSGAVAADQRYGTRGLIGQANHGYAHRTRILQSWSPWNADTVATYTEGGGVLLTVGGEEPLELGADVSTLTLVTDSTTAFTQLTTSEGNTGNTLSAARQALSTTIAITDQTGIPIRVYIQLRRAGAGVTAYLYRWVLYETILVAADLPA